VDHSAVTDARFYSDRRGLHVMVVTHYSDGSDAYIDICYNIWYCHMGVKRHDG